MYLIAFIIFNFLTHFPRQHHNCTLLGLASAWVRCWPPVSPVRRSSQLDRAVLAHHLARRVRRGLVYGVMSSGAGASGVF